MKKKCGAKEFGLTKRKSRQERKGKTKGIVPCNNSVVPFVPYLTFPIIFSYQVSVEKTVSTKNSKELVVHHLPVGSFIHLNFSQEKVGRR